MDEGLPIAYEVLEKNVPVYASGGEVIGTVDHVVAAFDKDIFHGIVITTDQGRRFVFSDQVASLHEHGVDLDIEVAEAAALPLPEGAAPVWRDKEPGVKPSEWRHLLGYFTPRGDRSGWTREN
jgi:sporulation protein YlmC with PRC-barrel domain